MNLKIFFKILVFEFILDEQKFIRGKNAMCDELQEWTYGRKST